MTIPAVVDITTPLDLTNSSAPTAHHAWLEAAAKRTAHPGVRRLIADIAADLDALGAVDDGLGDELADVILGALASVAAAIDVEALTAELN